MLLHWSAHPHQTYSCVYFYFGPRPQSENIYFRLFMISKQLDINMHAVLVQRDKSKPPTQSNTSTTASQVTFGLWQVCDICSALLSCPEYHTAVLETVHIVINILLLQKSTWHVCTHFSLQITFTSQLQSFHPDCHESSEVSDL